ncbi:MAG: tRNA (adenosine(37)-N6)-threonylcarbamoyltransferase complex ATPase subunit type 1 TsaE [Alphaproteobacteria bacterium]
MATDTLNLPDLPATQALAARLAPQLEPGDLILLYGDLGAGKTAFARCLIHALGIEDEVPSPTFTLVQTYPVEGRTFESVWHMDLYRLEAPEEAWELGLEEALETGVTLIEWPERLGEDILPDHLALHFDFIEDGRQVRIQGHGAWQDRAQKMKNRNA